MDLRPFKEKTERAAFVFFWCASVCVCDKEKDGPDFDVNGVARANNYRAKIVDAPHYGVSGEDR